MTSPPCLECRGLTKRMPSGDRMLTILEELDLQVAHGDFVAVLGPSGSGKSTLLGLLAGLDRPTDGSVLLEGEALETRSEDELALLRRRKVGFVFQSFHLLANLTAEENVSLPLELLGESSAGERARELLAQVGLSERFHHYPSQLSGGEQQRVALARAFAARPSILLADEPTGSLDRETGDRVLELLLELREQQQSTTILVTHDPKIAERAQRRIYLDGGKITRDESSRD